MKIQVITLIKITENIGLGLYLEFQSDDRQPVNTNSLRYRKYGFKIIKNIYPLIDINQVVEIGGKMFLNLIQRDLEYDYVLCIQEELKSILGYNKDNPQENIR